RRPFQADAELLETIVRHLHRMTVGEGCGKRQQQREGRAVASAETAARIAAGEPDLLEADGRVRRVEHRLDIGGIPVRRLGAEDEMERSQGGFVPGETRLRL